MTANEVPMSSTTPRSFPQHPVGDMGFPTEVVLVRHARSADVVPGEPESFDPPLHPDGVIQAQALARRLHPKTLDAVYASDLIRTQQTAAPVLEGRQLDLAIRPDLREVFLGDWEGGIFRQKAADGGPEWQQFIDTGRWDAIPGAESDAALRSRMVGAVDGIAADHEGQSVLVVSHGGAINAFLAEILGVPRTQFTAVENTGVTIVRYGFGRRMLLTVNDTHHLYDPLLGLPSSERVVG
jgi:2,3-bisphosphoglycerate-dependent phosphoglycerate mutase